VLRFLLIEHCHSLEASLPVSPSGAVSRPPARYDCASHQLCRNYGPQITTLSKQRTNVPRNWDRNVGMCAKPEPLGPVSHADTIDNQVQKSTQPATAFCVCGLGLSWHSFPESVNITSQTQNHHHGARAATGANWPIRAGPGLGDWSVRKGQPSTRGHDTSVLAMTI
jgi:hypothetical protein